jgi:hypothetical protein
MPQNYCDLGRPIGAESPVVAKSPAKKKDTPKRSYPTVELDEDQIPGIGKMKMGEEVTMPTKFVKTAHRMADAWSSGNKARITMEVRGVHHGGKGKKKSDGKMDPKEIGYNG